MTNDAAVRFRREMEAELGAAVRTSNERHTCA